MSPASARRPPGDVLARARVLCLVSTVAEGFPADELRGEVPRFHLEATLTADESAWLDGSAEPGSDVSWQVEAMLALAWTLGLAPSLGDRDPETYGPVQEQLVVADDAEASLAPRPDEDLRAMLAHLDLVAAAGEPPPPHERYGAETLHFRRAALRWALDRSLPWPP
jgi:hypothetical protein